MNATVTKKRLGKQGLRMLADGAPFMTWQVLTEDSIEDVLSPGYFEGYVNVVEPFDRIEVTCEAASETPKHLRLVVRALISTTAGEVRKRLIDWRVDAIKSRQPTTALFQEVIVEPMRYETCEPPAPQRAKAA